MFLPFLFSNALNAGHIESWNLELSPKNARSYLKKKRINGRFAFTHLKECSCMVLQYQLKFQRFVKFWRKISVCCQHWTSVQRGLKWVHWHKTSGYDDWLTDRLTHNSNCTDLSGVSSYQLRQITSGQPLNQAWHTGQFWCYIPVERMEKSKQKSLEYQTDMVDIGRWLHALRLPPRLWGLVVVLALIPTHLDSQKIWARGQ